MALNVEKVTEFIAPEADWLDNRYCGKDDDTFYRELPEAEVLWHVLQLSPETISGRRASRAQAGRRVNTTDVKTATRLGIAVANMPGPIDTRRQSAARPGQRGTCGGQLPPDRRRVRVSQRGQRVRWLPTDRLIGKARRGSYAYRDQS